MENICLSYFDKNFQTKKHKLLNNEFDNLIVNFIIKIENIQHWELDLLENAINNYIENRNIKFISLGKPLRLLLTNMESGPSISNILMILGKKNSILRIKEYIRDI